MEFKTVVFQRMSPPSGVRQPCVSSPRATRCMRRSSCARLLQRGRPVAAAAGRVPRHRARMVYVGAVMVLFLFVVMMLDINLDRCGRLLELSAAGQACRRN